MSTFSDRKEPFTAEEHATWADIVALHRERRDVQLCSLFLDGVRRLEFDRPNIPELREVNARLGKLTGWQGVYVRGLEDGDFQLEGNVAVHASMKKEQTNRAVSAPRHSCGTVV